jgi:hypothetical protein
MSFSNSFENSLALLLFNNASIANVGDAAGLQPSAAPGVLYARLHTADPGEGGTGDTSEADYTGYAPVSIARSGAGFTVTGNQVANAATIQFGECTAGTNSISFVSFCLGSGAGAVVLVRAALGATRAVSAGITPLFNPGTVQGTLD